MEEKFNNNPRVRHPLQEDDLSDLKWDDLPSAQFVCLDGDMQKGDYSFFTSELIESIPEELKKLVLFVLKKEAKENPEKDFLYAVKVGIEKKNKLIEQMKVRVLDMLKKEAPDYFSDAAGLSFRFNSEYKEEENKSLAGGSEESQVTA